MLVTHSNLFLSASSPTSLFLILKNLVNCQNEALSESGSFSCCPIYCLGVCAWRNSVENLTACSRNNTKDLRAHNGQDWKFVMYDVITISIKSLIPWETWSVTPAWLKGSILTVDVILSLSFGCCLLRAWRELVSPLSHKSMPSVSVMISCEFMSLILSDWVTMFYKDHCHGVHQFIVETLKSTHTPHHLCFTHYADNLCLANVFHITSFYRYIIRQPDQYQFVLFAV